MPELKNIDTLFKNELSKPLPGEMAQLKMAPTYRHQLLQPESYSKAGVLVLIYISGEELFTAFMKRTEYPGVHSGQISFPGGRFDPSDKTTEQTALRETEEEFGISANSIKILGNLTPLLIPVSKTEIFPYVGFINHKPLFNPDKREVDYIIEAQIKSLQNPEIIKSKPSSYNQLQGTIPYYEFNNHHIWGATAMVLSEFLVITEKVI